MDKKVQYSQKGIHNKMLVYNEVAFKGENGPTISWNSYWEGGTRVWHQS